MITQQLDLWGRDVPVFSIERLEIGTTAPQLVETLMGSHPVEAFLYTQYDPRYRSDNMPLDSVDHREFLPWEGMDAIRHLSQQVVEESSKQKDYEEEETLLAPIWIIAVCSLVKVDVVDVKGGEVPFRNFRMLDFKEGVDIEEIVEWGLPPGVILKTDRSFHYYGFDLLLPDEWRLWMSSLIARPLAEDLLGDWYLRLNRGKGYTALRIFGYEDTWKPTTPEIVARIT